ncbi:MAG: DUF2306 domain-containing protein [Hyphomicrobiales bacterium]|nr:DUF2306 domain-containing protein [Hyphomicrobiales bacterium]
MTLSPLLAAGPVIQFHVVAVSLTILLTLIQLLLERGSDWHRRVGRVWMIAMALTALSSFFISTIQWIGPFSPLHLLSIISLISLLIAYRAAHRGDVKSHSRTLLSLVIFALIIPGIFTLFPGRLMYRVVFGG